MKKLYPKYTPNISHHSNLYPKLSSYFWQKFTIVWISSHRHQFHHKICPGTLRSIFVDCFWRTFFFAAHKKMHISEYVCKTCLKELGILLKCREIFEKFLAACNCSKNTGFPQFFTKVSDNCILFKNINFLTKIKRCLLCWLLWIRN